MYKIKLSPYARIFYTEWLLDPNSYRYNISIDRTLYGDLDIEILRTALKRYVSDHVLLNSHVQDINGEPYWVKNDNIVELEYLENPADFSELLNYANRSFDLHNKPLYRFRLLRISDDVYRFVIVLHHIVIDGVSLYTGVYEAISKYYNNENYVTNYSIGEQVKLITGLTDTLSARLQQNLAKYKEFWHQRLSGVGNIDLSFLKLSQDHVESGISETDNPIGEIKFSYGEIELTKLEQIKLKYGITVYVYGMCIFAMLLHRYTGLKCLAISYPIAIREGSDFIYGAQINTNLITYHFDQNTTITDLFNQSQEFFKLAMHDNIRYSYYPVADIIRESNNKGLLNIYFTHTFFREEIFEFAGITKTVLHTELVSDGPTKNILLFEQNVRNSKNRLSYRTRYDKKTISKELLSNFVTTYRRLYIEVLEDLLVGNDNKTLSYSLLDSKQYRKIVYELNQTEKDYPRDKTVHTSFEEQALKNPDNIAVAYENRKLTYEELNQKANQLANYLLINYNIKSGDLVVLCLDKSEQMILALFGVLKAGGAYVPVDPNYPDERIYYILNDTKARVIITNDVYKARLERLKRESKAIDIMAVDTEQIQAKLAIQKTNTPLVQTNSGNLIYVIYRYGTAGKPKGVLLEHRSVVNYVIYLINEAKLDEKSVGSQYAAFDFYASITEIYPILLSGGALYLIKEQDLLDLDKINNFFNQNGITYAFLPTKIAELFFKIKNTSLKNLVVGGEKLEKYIQQVYRVIYSHGSSETTVQPTSFIVDKPYTNIPIGKPINNVKCYVVDSNLKVLPPGAIGELVIGGECLSRGYLNLPDLTKERFIYNPFQTQEEKIANRNNKLYKTGDLVRMLPDGNMEYIGRNGPRVRIKGYHVELEEIEKAMLDHPEIKQVAVLIKKLNDKDNRYLIIYYSSRGKLNELSLKSYLANKLPEYMMPNIWIQLDSLPLTINGKIDRSILPEPDLTNQLKYTTPRNGLEEDICKIYAQVLSLPVQQVGIIDDFFEMGGDSISGIQIVSRVRQQLGLNISVKDIFNHRSVRQLITKVLMNKDYSEEENTKKTKQEDEGKIISHSEYLNKTPADRKNVRQSATNVLINQNLEGENTEGIKQEDEEKIIAYLHKIRENPEVEDVYLANNLQQGLIYHAIRQGKADGAYISQLVWKYDIPIDEERFKEAWQLAQKKYPNLRLRFAWDSELIQIVDKNQELDFKYINLTDLFARENSDCQSRIKNIMEKAKREPFDLQEGNLIRICLIKLSVNNYLCVCTVHHIISDGWGCSVLLNSVHEIYSHLLENRLQQITEDITYKKAQEYLQEHKDENYKYWYSYLRQMEDRVDLKPLLKASARNVNIKNHLRVEQKQEQRIEMTGSKLAKLKDFCRINAVTINAVVQYVWHKILHVYGASNTTIVGTIVAGRNIPVDNIGDSTGLFINTLPLIYIHDSESVIAEQIKIIQNLIHEINNRSNISLAKLQIEGERLFDSLIVYENYPPPKYFANIKCERIQESFKVDYPLTVIAYEKEQILTIKLKYAGELFSQKAIARLLNRVLFFIEQILENPHRKTLNYLDQDEYQRLVLDYNKTERNYPRDKTIHRLFEEQALKTPNHVAVIDPSGSYTYFSISDKVDNLVANLYLHNKNSTNHLIAVLSEKGYQQVVATLAIMKSGNAYLPLSVDWPIGRIKEVLEEGQVQTLVVSHKQYERIIENNLESKYKVLVIEDTSSNRVSEHPKIHFADVIATDVAYVIFTSGSTGKPKGVIISHRGAVNTIYAINERFNISEQDKVLALSELSFDLSVYDIFGLLASGGTVVFPEQSKTKEPEHWLSLIKKYNVTIWNTVPQLLYALVDYADITQQCLKPLRLTLMSGDWIPIGLANQIKAHNPDMITISLGGATEGSIWSVWYEIDKVNAAWSSIPYGRAMPNQKMYVLGDNLQPLPDEVVGEIYIGGDGVALGYWNNHQGTTASFTDHPQLGRIYKTGDLGRWNKTGYMEIQGRKDNQVKLRGYRVELGEIASNIARLEGVNESIVAIKKHKNTQILVAYYTSQAKAKITQKEIVERLKQSLPEYMIPQVFVKLKNFPLTVNGKVDMKALPKPGFVKKNGGATPRNEQERLVCGAFAKTLSLKKVGIDDDFFFFGGNSILAIKLVSMLQANFDVKIADVFDLRTPKKIAQNSAFGKNFLQHRLEQIKLAYRTKQNGSELIETRLQQEPDEYLKSIEGLSIDLSLKKPIYNVLLTGSTGYLGCNILNQLLESTNYKVYLLVRANSQEEAIEKINRKYQFYFDKDLVFAIDKRVFVLRADVEQNYLGLSIPEYQGLAVKIDSVIHAAALVKHYGEYDRFYSANVGATVNLLEFARLTKLKDFHYISTSGVLNYMPILNGIKSICAEDDLPVPSEILNNVYVQTKLLGEHQVSKYQDFGLNCNIYRVGNLAFISENYRTQKNIEDNAFYNWLRCLFVIKYSTESINTVEISQTDLTAQAIVKIFDKGSLSNQIYHVFNPYLFNMSDILKNKGFRMLPTETFIDCISQYINDGSYHDLIVQFLLYQGWLDWWEKQSIVPVKILQNRTQYVLKQLGFEWIPVTEKILCRYFDVLKLNI